MRSQWIGRIPSLHSVYFQQCFTKPKKEGATLVLVASLWTVQPWWPLLIELIIVDYSICLGNDPKLLQDVSNQGAIYLQYSPSLKLAVWTISGNITKQWEFQRQLSISSATASRAQPPKLTMSPGLSWVAGVRKGKVIPYYFQYLSFWPSQLNNFRRVKNTGR